jgi:hypothetical protein
MGWFDDDDWERMKNFTIYNIWATDKERDEMLDNPGCIVLAVGILAIIIAFVAWLI